VARNGAWTAGKSQNLILSNALLNGFSVMHWFRSYLGQRRKMANIT